MIERIFQHFDHDVQHIARNGQGNKWSPHFLKVGMADQTLIGFEIHEGKGGKNEVGNAQIDYVREG